jgi:hypothetical protein
MTNYWLSNLGYQVNKIKSIQETSKPSYSGNKEPSDDNDDDSVDDDSTELKLNDRQKMMHEHYEHVVEEYGKFNKSAKADGAHYASAAANPFKNEGMICGNCVYFIGGGGCEIVSGSIESDAICKLWIIPETLIKVKK